jgi:hypothetical protein
MLSVCLRISALPTVARQRLGKHVPAVPNTHTTVEVLLDVVFSMWSMSYEIFSMW